MLNNSLGKTRTNLYQTSDSHNNVFGRTLNPWNTTLGPGGSSGGEGALIALRGSPLGLGTDIAGTSTNQKNITYVLKSNLSPGSVRIPAHCCGTYGFRPSASRVPNGGMRICTTPGMKFILSCIGPLSMDLNGIETFFQLLFNARPAKFDSSIHDIPWRQVDKKPVLRIGVVPESFNFPLHPPIRRVLAEAVHLLEAQGHQIIHLDEKDCHILEANEIASAIFNLDQNARKLIASAGEPVVPALGHIMKIFEKAARFIKPSLPDMSTLDRMEKLALLNVRRAELREAYRKLWVEHDLDICIAPPAGSTAVPHDMFGIAPYTTFLNCLDVGYLILWYEKLLIKLSSIRHASCRLEKWTSKMPGRRLSSKKIK